MDVHNSVIHNGQKVETTQYQQTDEWINKISYIDTMGYYSAIKRNEILTYTTTWMNLENNMLSKMYHSPKTHIAWFYLYDMSGIGKFI